MIVITATPKIEISHDNGNVKVSVKGINRWDEIESSEISFPALCLRDVVDSLIDIRDSVL